MLFRSLTGGFVTKPSNGWYAKAGSENKYRLKETNNKDFWNSILNDQKFKDYVESSFKISANDIAGDLEYGDIEEAYDNASTDL